MPKHALITFGGWPGHEPKPTSERFAAYLRSQGFEVTLSDSLDSYADAALMGRLDLIVQSWTMGTLSKEQWQVLDATVKAGCGFAGWHGGVIDAFRGHIDFQALVGAQFLSHPGNIRPYEVVCPDFEEPITAGFDRFTVTTEQYYMMVDPSIKVLAHTTFDGVHAPEYAGVQQPVVWKKRWGKGKVFVSALGHVDQEFTAEAPRVLMERGLLWAAR